VVYLPGFRGERGQPGAGQNGAGASSVRLGQDTPRRRSAPVTRKMDIVP
jgi:hypothetical protein